MGRMVDDLEHLKADIQHIHDDVEHLGKDLDSLAEKAGQAVGGLPAFTDLKDHLRDLDAHAHDVMSHVAHVKAESVL